MQFYFYDLETSGLSSSAQRIMQFGGIRTDEDLNVIGEPLECYVKLGNEILPDPQAVLVTGITPQKTLEEGYTEPEFIDILTKHMFQPNTVIAGYNSIRFDDEFIRHLMWRNLRDPYEWHWKDGRSRWDILDLVRTTRALRPDGVTWPESGNRLEEITKVNNIQHSQAHTALSDVEATIEVAKLIKKKQPKLFSFLLNNRSKTEVGKLVNLANPEPFVHTSGMISSDFSATSVFYPIAKHPANPQAILCFDLRFNPEEFADLTSEEMQERAFSKHDELTDKGLTPLPVKGIHINKSPSVAPLGVLDKASQDRIDLNIATIESNLKKLKTNAKIATTVANAYSQQPAFDKSNDPEQQLYDGFLGDKDRDELRSVLRVEDIAKLDPSFSDARLTTLFDRYKARNFYSKLSETEQQAWQEYRDSRFKNGLKGALSAQEYVKQIAELKKQYSDNKQKEFLLEELELYLEGLS